MTCAPLHRASMSGGWWFYRYCKNVVQSRRFYDSYLLSCCGGGSWGSGLLWLRLSQRLGLMLLLRRHRSRPLEARGWGVAPKRAARGAGARDGVMHDDGCGRWRGWRG